MGIWEDHAWIRGGDGRLQAKGRGLRRCRPEPWSLQNFEEIKFCRLSHPGWYFVVAALANEYTPEVLEISNSWTRFGPGLVLGSMECPAAERDGELGR